MDNQTQKITDESLVKMAQSGDRSALEQLCVRYGEVVRSKARRFFLIGGETEDLVQEGMLGLCAAVIDYKDGDKSLSFKNFAHLCISRRIADALRASASKKNLPLNNYVPLMVAAGEALEIDPEEGLIRSEGRVELQEKMRTVLSEMELEIMMLYIDGMSTADICEKTGKTNKSIDNALQRSKKKLQKLYTEQR
ncbi:MAG: sigma-70 family RNA polymerase sigma factor [Clostridia bacterium]|nr:sigma-70 family RNA polymerase sigma factor [Clostridia bacterium]